MVEDLSSIHRRTQVQFPALQKEVRGHANVEDPEVTALPGGQGSAEQVRGEPREVLMNRGAGGHQPQNTCACFLTTTLSRFIKHYNEASSGFATGGPWEESHIHGGVKGDPSDQARSERPGRDKLLGRSWGHRR